MKKAQLFLNQVGLKEAKVTSVRIPQRKLPDGLTRCKGLVKVIVLAE